MGDATVNRYARYNTHYCQATIREQDATAIDREGTVDEKIKYLFLDKPKDYVGSSLKWGMVLIAVGLGVFVGQMAPPDLVQEITTGAMLIFGGLALVHYYIIASRRIKKSEEERNVSQMQ